MTAAEIDKLRAINVELLAAAEAQHDALDTLLAMLTERDKTFMPTKSPAWPALLQGNAAIKLAHRFLEERLVEARASPS
jgi:hypothetical protein